MEVLNFYKSLDAIKKMGVLDFLVLMILLLLLVTGLYFLWLNYPSDSQQLEEYKAEVSFDLPQLSSQFYPNMRYPDREISYSISKSCSTKRKSDFEDGIKYLEDRTILDFYEVATDAQIEVICSNLAPKPDEEGHFIAGEGGPSYIINSSKFSVITSGRIALYRPETCSEPKVAVHEMLHALGFDHNSNPNSIMYPITDCKQELDPEIINEIRELYSFPSVGDLLIEGITANKTGRYLSFEITVANVGLKEIKNSEMYVYVDGEELDTFDLNDIDLGAKRHLSVTNLRIPRSSEEIRFLVRTTEPEFTTTNNEAIVRAT